MDPQHTNRFDQLPRLASLEMDSWCLRSGEAQHALSPETFWIPEAERRDSLTLGDAAKLIFDQEGYEQSGEVTVLGERMWVLVADRIGSRYIGRLDNEPRLIDQNEDTYLRVGAEVPFDPEHVVDVAKPPPAHVTQRLAAPPTRLWPR